VELEVDRPGGEVQRAQRPGGRGAHVEEADDRVRHEHPVNASDSASADDDGAGGGQQVTPAVRRQHRRAVRRDVGHGPPPGPRVQQQDPPVRGPDREQAARGRRERRGAMRGRVGARFGNAERPLLSTATTGPAQVHRHQRGFGPPRDEHVAPGARQRSNAGVFRLRQVQRAERGERPAPRDVDRESGPGGDGDGAAAERSEALDAASARSRGAVAFEGGAGGAVDGAGVGSWGGKWKRLKKRMRERGDRRSTTSTSMMLHRISLLLSTPPPPTHLSTAAPHHG